MNHDRWYTKALEAADNSTHDKCTIGACIVKGNWLIATGWNQKKSHPKQKHYNKTRNLNCNDYLHAEIHSLVRSGREDVEGADIYVARLDKKGKPANCKPCKACAKAIEDAGISRVFYFNEKGEKEFYGLG